MSLNRSLFSSDSFEWETPKDLFDSLNDEFHFDLDVCASVSNHKCDTYFTINDDGLSKDWFGNVWCNPPYGRSIKDWVKKCYDYSGLSVLLVPSRTDTKWFHDFIYHNDRCEIRFLKGRLKFNNSKNSAPFPSMVVIFKDLL